MTRLIDADALNLEYEVDMADDWKTAHEIANIVKYAPTVDAVPVIRCEDCIHHHGYICDRLYGLQDAFTLQDNDYCSYAEPKEKK